MAGWFPFGSPALIPTSGNNQIGLNGIAYYFNLQPFNNWVKSGNAPTWTLTYAGFITSIVAHPTVAGWLQATTSSAHGLYNPNYTNQPFGVTGVGSWTITINNVKNGGTPLSGWTHNGNSDVVVDGPNTFSWVATVGTGTPTVADMVVLLDAGNPPNKGSSLHGANNDLFQFIDINGDLQPSIPNVTSAFYSQTVYGLDFTSGANVPPGFSRAGQKFSIQWQSGTGTNSIANSTANATAPATVDFTWVSSLDNVLVSFNIAVPTADISNPPKQIYYGPNNDGTLTYPLVTIDGHAGELAAWNAGIYLSKSYTDFLKATAGVIRTMDWCATNIGINFNNFSQWPALASNRWGSGGSEALPTLVTAVPFEGLMQLANRANKRPWLNIPHSFSVTKSFSIIGITKSAAGFNSILTTGTAASPLSIPAKHNFVTGDSVIVNFWDTGIGIPSVTNASASISIPSNNITWTAHGFPAGQAIIFPNGGGNTNPGQTYYVASGAGLLTNSFQIATTLANALAGTVFTFSVSGGTVTATSQINHTQFVVGATTDYTIELLHCDSSSFGAVTSAGQYATGNTIHPGGFVTTPFDLTHFGTQVTAMANAAIAQLNSNIVPSWEFGNELWNPGFPSNTMLLGQAQNFVDASGTRVLGTGGISSAKMVGYLYAHLFKTIRDAYGGSGGRSKWIGNLSTNAGNPSWTVSLFAGMDLYISTFVPTLTRNDLFDNVAILGYWGGGIYKGNGTYFITSASASTFTIDPANTAPSTVTVPSNSNTSASNPNWQYPFLPIIFGGSGTLPTDLATGAPLVNGNGGQLTGFNISGINSSGVMTVTSVNNFPTNTLAPGQSIWLSTNNGACSFWGFTYRKITSQLTGITGSAGTYQTDSNVVQAAASGMLALDTSVGNGVYWTLPPSTSTTMQFCRHENLARFTGSISGNTLTVTTPPLAGTPQIATGMKVGGIGISERTITAGSGLSWTLNGATQTVTNAAGLVNNMGAYNPVVLDTANPGSGTFVCQWGGATLLRRWMNDSAALAVSTPATWTNKYAYWNRMINDELAYGTNGFGGAPIKPFNGGPGSGYSGYFITDFPPLVVGGTGGVGTSIMPNAPGIVQYEGSNGNYPSGVVAGTSGLPMNVDPQFYEFLPQTAGTTEQAALWTLQQQVWTAMPTYASQTPYSYNVTGIIMKEQAWFTDVVNVSAKFQFGAVYFCDDVSGFGSPNWQQPVNGHPVYDALVASN